MRKSRLHSRLLAATALVLVATAVFAQDAAPQLYSQGNRALSLGRLYEAIDLFRDALEINPTYLEPTIGLAESYFRLNEYDQALSHVERALVLARNDPRVRTLKARISLAMGDLQTAAMLFTSVLDAQPNNIDARLGLAELAAARGRNVEAAGELLRAHQLSHDDQRTLLSLVLVYDELGDAQRAERYLQLALETHQTEPAVHVLAAEHYLRNNQFEAALDHARVALALEQANRAAARLFAEAALSIGDYQEALAMSGQLIAVDRTDTLAWYIRALALIGTGEIDQALVALQTALRGAEDDEVARLVLEELVIAELDLEDERRAPLALFHANRAAGLADDHRYSLALETYRQALRINPYDLATRRAYAELHRSLGNLSTYLQELTVARDLGADGRDLQNRIEVYTGVLSRSVSRRWETDQFSLARSGTSLWIAAAPHSTDVLHPRATGYLLGAASRTLQSDERVRVAGSSLEGDFGELFAVAREAACDYLLTFAFTETERSFSINATVYLARTGTQVYQTYVERTGLHRVQLSMLRVAQQIGAAFPLRGTILDRDGERALLDIGRRDGLAPEEQLAVLEPDGILLNPNDTGLQFGAGSVLATATVTTVDDLVAEATLEVGIVDRVAVGDLVVVPGEQAVEASEQTLFPSLYQRLRRIQAR